MNRLARILLLAGALAPGLGTELARATDNSHLGVASCAASTCHGRVAPADNADIALNEYFIWSKYDHHANAYRTLQGAWSRRIAANLGLKNASTAPECLGCHSDPVAASRQGERFQISDGIGCEACHGGASGWIDSHYGPTANHAANLENGLRATEQPQVQARLCQGCHLGDSQRIVSHQMMAAGHPRLRFELDTWLTNMPPHHVEDTDYRQRKQPAAVADRWAIGIAAAAGGYLDMLAQHVQNPSLTPELSLFDCHACHRPMDTGVRRSPQEKRLIPAGTVRPNDYAMRTLAIIIELRDPALAERIRRENHAFHQAAAHTKAAFLQQAAQLRQAVSAALPLLKNRPLSPTDRARLRSGLLQTAADGHFRDYADAEQLFLALQALAAQAESPDPARYDTLFRLLANEQAFDPRRVTHEAAQILRGASR